MTNKSTEKETEHSQYELERLRLEHHDLDDVIARLANDPAIDDFELRRLKKRKLHLKDQIAILESKTLHS